MPFKHTQTHTEGQAGRVEARRYRQHFKPSTARLPVWAQRLWQWL